MNLIESLTQEEIDYIFKYVQAKRQRERRAAAGDEGRLKRNAQAREYYRRNKLKA